MALSPHAGKNRAKTRTDSDFVLLAAALVLLGVVLFSQRLQLAGIVIAASGLFVGFLALRR